jgi:Tol biopolymer transport system component
VSAGTSANQQAAAEIRQELQAILSSAEFVGSARLCRFLEFVVGQYLRGSAGDLKETVIGVEVFDREPGYDPKLEPIVRTEARRLRSKLEHYYETIGRDRPVRILIPKGGYAPVVEIRRPALVPVPIRPEPSVPAPVARPLWKKPWPIAAALLALAVIAAGAIIIVRTSRERRPEPMEITVTSFPGWQSWPSFSPDGSQIAFTWDGEQQDNPDVYVTMATGGSPRRLTTDPEPDQVPAWSPDGRSIAFVRAHREVILTSPLGGAERHLTSAGYPALAWMPDSGSLAFVDTSAGGRPLRIFLISLSSGETRELTHPPADSTGDYQMAFSPDGKHMAFARCRLAECDLYVMPATGGAPRKVTNTRRNVRGLVWTPEGRDIVFSSGKTGFSRLWRVPAFSSAEPAQVSGTADNATFPTVVRTANGRLQLAYVYEHLSYNFWILELGRSPRLLIPSTRIDSSPQFSPDGGRIAFVSDRSGAEEVWVVDSSGENATQLSSFGAGSCGSPRWSPDGSRIVFDYLGDKGRALHVIGAGGGPVRRLTSWGELGRASFSRDGRWIYYLSRQSGTFQVWKLEAASGTGLSQPVQVTTDGGFEAYESPDGSVLYYTRDDQLWSQPVAGGAASLVLEGVHHGWWAVTTAGIFFVDLREARHRFTPKPINFLDFRTGRVTIAGKIDGRVDPARPDFCVTRDGRRILYALERSGNAEIRMLLDPW